MNPFSGVGNGEVLVLGSYPRDADTSAFSSPASHVLKKMLAKAGIEARLDYVLERKLEKGEKPYLDARGHIPSRELEKAFGDVVRRIKAFKPKLIIACGKTALQALTSRVTVDDCHCYVLKQGEFTIIPTLCFNEIYKDPSNAFWLQFALNKAKQYLDGHRDEEVDLEISNNLVQACNILDRIIERKNRVCIDIETAGKTEVLTSFGVSWEVDGKVAGGLSVSCTDNEDPAHWAALIERLRVILADPEIPKIGQNFTFASLILWRIYGMKVAGDVWDTLHAANVIYSDLPKDLESLIRLYLFREPHKGSWKSTGHDLRLYNAKDIVTTHQIAIKQHEHLTELGLLEYFESTPKALFVPAFDMMIKGFKVDVYTKNQVTKQLDAVLKDKRASLEEWAKEFVPMAQRKRMMRNPIADIEAHFPEPIEAATTKELKEKLKGVVPSEEIVDFYVANKSAAKHGLTPGVIYKKAYKAVVDLENQVFNPGSPSQLKSVFDNAKIKLPKVKGADGKWGESTNEIALLKLLTTGKLDESQTSFVENVRSYRAAAKLQSSYCKAAIDPDGRWRCTYNIEGTDTGRSASKKTLWNTGGNIQNIPRKVFGDVKFKNLFIVDEGYTLFQSDQSSAEARIVAYLSECDKLIELIETGQDIHVYAINSVLGEDITIYKETDPKKYNRLRQIGKMTSHGSNYDVGPATLADQALKQGVELTVKEADFFLKERAKVFPEIKEWHQSVQEQLHRTKMLVTPFGRRRVFLGRIDENVYRKAYAFVPQSTIPHITNLMWLWVAAQKDYDASVLQMGHDALVMAVKTEQLADFVKAYLLTTKGITFTIGSRSNLNIPWDAEVGERWGSLKGFDVNTET
jgi:DNA polymerase I-like protein with 3'-5' exonuclease and polymerase domains/uracil-DNA glycosylase